MPGLRAPTARQSGLMTLAAGPAERFDAQVADNERRSRFPLENHRALHDSGYLRLALPDRFGGEGVDLFDMVLAQEILARGDASTALVCGMGMALMGRVLDGNVLTRIRNVPWFRTIEMSLEGPNTGLTGPERHEARGWWISVRSAPAHSRPATQRQYVRMGDRAGVWAGAPLSFQEDPLPSRADAARTSGFPRRRTRF